MSKVRLILLGLLTALAVGAIASASASASGPYAYLKGGSSPLMGSLELQFTQLSPAVMKSKLAGVNIEIFCETSTSTGSVENVLTSGVEHFLGLHLVHFLKCTMPKPAAGECKVHNELIHVHVHVLGIPGPAVEATPEQNPYLTLVTVENCRNSSLNGTYEVTGTLVASANNTDSTIEYTETSGSNLKVGANAAVFLDTFQIEMKGGGLLELK